MLSRFEPRSRAAAGAVSLRSRTDRRPPRVAATFVLLLGALACVLSADEPTAQQAAGKPIRALLVTGGCCHDYDRQKLILPKGVSARANVEWTVVHQGGTTTDTAIPLYDDPDWADGYDIVVHNECFSGVKDKAFVERILKPHREGLPAVLIHCAMHCYRTGDDAWFEFCGVQSPGHGPHYAYTVDNRAPDSPIMKGFGENWTVPKGELYHSLKLWPTCTPLATANRQEDGQPQTCIWTNEYGKARVFATTIGHYNETMAEPKYLDMLTRGILWACDRDLEKEFRPADAATDEAIKKLLVAKRAGGENQVVASTPCCGAGNLLAGKPTKASSEETGKNNFARNAVDGNLSTRWCASSPKIGETWEVDLGVAAPIKSLRLHWEGNAAYKYRIDVAKESEDWTTVVDQSKNGKSQRIVEHVFDAPVDAKKLRVTYLGSNTGAWGSLWEVEAYSDSLPPLPEGADKPGGKPPAPGISDVQAPPEFEVSLFGAPPEVNYPACLAAAATGEVYVGVDPQGSLGKKENEGKILRCRDLDGDGVADEITEFARVDHPRGLITDRLATGGDQVWCLHPPFLSLLTDKDGDGVAEDQKVLVSGISTEKLVRERGADHTTNGIHLGIDGWIYVAVGDFGIFECEGTDGTKLNKKGGGVLRVRPDGSEMEVFCWGLRNIYDVCIDPTLNLFSRDNTNDGGGWNVRTTHLIQSGLYGYPTHYDRFTEEILPPLADHGGGSGCGGMYVHDARLPGVFGDAAYTCDWGRSEVYRHNFPAAGATFAPHQEVFVKIPRPTDLTVDGSGLIYIASWKNGGFSFDGENVGFVAQLRPTNYHPKPAPDFAKLSDDQLVAELSGPSALLRLAAQRELLRREESEATVKALYQSARDADAPLYGRVAAIFALKQLLGARANEGLLRLADDASVREWALRALTDRKSELSGVTKDVFVAALADDNPRVRAQALISLGRLGDASAAEAILPLTMRPADQPLPSESPLHAQPDPARVIPHLAVRALVELAHHDAEVVNVLLAGLDGPSRAGAVEALKYLHSPKAVDGLAQRLKTAKDEAAKRELISLLVRLHSREGDYKGDWWGTRPDHSGPYYDPVAWEGTPAAAQALAVAYRSSAPETRDALAKELVRLKVKLDGIEIASAETMTDEATPISLPTKSTDPNAILNLSYEDAFERASKTPGDAAKGKELFAAKQCNACHTDAEGQEPKGPHLVDIGKRYKRNELVESILRPSAKLAQGFESWAFVDGDGRVVNGFVVSESAGEIEIRQADGKAVRLKKDDLEARKKIETSVMPEGLVGDLAPERLADLLAYLESLKKE